ncbi:MAG: flagellar basal body L-ring protein FlgH [Magnetococcales bacterium]|nr:flagellar basal body L-ring protein FlgH [Magnetococcales bacterium]MBF0150586.1 flagellar basal body L-ring protein FlgH [Magnetococcales bacterium]MBF0171837.1 flagellar basal body L-ring protein FlgH [Magnetococcales bacterium]MBF0346120.1 flagellar basal body L-ring protein FlgH [Magnetococcales bacterium]
MKQLDLAVGVALVLALPLSGCGMTRASQRPSDPVAIIQPTPPETLAPNKGSIWQTTRRNSLFEDNKARYVGDIVKVRILESASSTNKAKTDVTKDSTTTFGVSSPDLDKLLKIDANKGISLNQIAQATGSGESKADGKSERAAKLTATISCLVTEVLANGNLRIEGRRDITMDNENQFIIISGIVRPEDIDNKNAINSDMIADARIEYSGEGDLSDVQRPNLIFRALSTLNLL